MSRQWRSRRSRWERQMGLGVCPSRGTGSTAPRSCSVNAFCVMVKTYSWIPKCKTKCIMYNLRVLNYAREIIQACKDISVGCRWYQSRFRGVNMSSEPSKELFNTIGGRHERNERQFFSLDLLSRQLCKAFNYRILYGRYAANIYTKLL